MIIALHKLVCFSSKQSGPWTSLGTVSLGLDQFLLYANKEFNTLTEFGFLMQ